MRQTMERDLLDRNSTAEPLHLLYCTAPRLPLSGSPLTLSNSVPINHCPSLHSTASSFIAFYHHSSFTMPSIPSDFASKPNRLSQIHSYTLCSHSCPPANRPLDTQPILDPFTNSSTLAGRCPKCDQAFRRDVESSILTRYLTKIKTVERQHGVFDEAFLDHQVAELYKERDAEVEKVWKGYSRRWGPGCVGRLENGRMKLAWERPARDSGRKTKGSEAEQRVK
jgi:hypothetical protein